MTYHKWTKAEEQVVRDMVLNGKSNEEIASRLGTFATSVASFRRRKRIGHPLVPGVPAEMNRKYCKKYYFTHYILPRIKKRS